MAVRVLRIVPTVQAAVAPVVLVLSAEVKVLKLQQVPLGSICWQQDRKVLSVVWLEDQDIPQRYHSKDL